MPCFKAEGKETEGVEREGWARLIMWLREGIVWEMAKVEQG